MEVVGFCQHSLLTVTELGKLLQVTDTCFSVETPKRLSALPSVEGNKYIPMQQCVGFDVLKERTFSWDRQRRAYSGSAWTAGQDPSAQISPTLHFCGFPLTCAGRQWRICNEPSAFPMVFCAEWIPVSTDTKHQICMNYIKKSSGKD